MAVNRYDDTRAWYAISTYSGYEDKVADSINQRTSTAEMKGKIFEAIVPKEKQIEIKNGKRKIVDRKILQGYVLVDMKLSDEERTEALDESVFLHGYNLNVDELVCGEALLVWPMKVLCREDCKGLCPVCGQNLNLKTCDCDRTDLDPRMAKIRDIFKNFKEV